MFWFGVVVGALTMVTGALLVLLGVFVLAISTDWDKS